VPDMDCFSCGNGRELERMHAPVNIGLAAVAGNFEVVVGLDAHPEFGRDVKQASEFERHFRADGAFAADDFADGNRRAADGLATA